MSSLVLASASPRRIELLKQIKLDFIVCASDVDETNHDKISCRDHVCRLAEQKVQKIARSPGKLGFNWILGADTMIEFEGRAIGKPSDREEAAEMIAAFSGKTHQVITGVSLFNRQNDHQITRYCVSDVSFDQLSLAQIEWYLNTCEWQGAAGGYRIQGIGACLIDRISGSYSNIVGLPIQMVYNMLIEQDFSF